MVQDLQNPYVLHYILHKTLTNFLHYVADGKPENTFAFSGEAKNKKYATEIIHECHESWRRLISGQVPAKTDKYDLSIANITQEDSVGLTSTQDPIYTSLPQATNSPPKPIDPASTFVISGPDYVLIMAQFRSGSSSLLHRCRRSSRRRIRREVDLAVSIKQCYTQ